MAGITPIFAFQNTGNTSANGDQTEQVGGIETTALADGVEYLVIWRAQIGGNDGSTQFECTVRHGPTGDFTGTTLGYSSGESGATNITLQSARGQAIQGFTRVTGNGTDVIKTSFRCITPTDNLQFGRGAIVALPLTGLTEGVDYFFDGTDADALELENASTADFETIRSVAFEMPGSPQDWIVGACTEAKPGEGADTESARVRFTVGGTQIGDCGGGDPFKHEWESDIDWFNIVWYQVLELSGSTTFLAEGQSEGQAESDYRRTRFFALRAAAFDQVIVLTDTTGAVASPTSYTTILSQAYTPNQTEHVLALCSLVSKSIGIHTRVALYRLYDDTADAIIVENWGQSQHNPDSGVDPDDGRDMIPMSIFGTKEISAETTFTIDWIRNGAIGNIAFGRSDDDALGIGSHLILIGLTLPALNLEVSPDPLALTLTEPTPTVTRNLSLSPDPTDLALTITAPTVGRVLDLTPDAVALALSVIEGAVARGALAVSPDPCELDLDFPDPTIDRTITNPVASANRTTTTRSRDYTDLTRSRDYSDTSRSN